MQALGQILNFYEKYTGANQILLSWDSGIRRTHQDYQVACSGAEQKLNARETF